jgi:UDP-N-acetylmuramate--alanine ligase
LIRLKKDVKVHFIGIGGIGMSALAEILLSLGYQVSGSDLVSSHTTERLKSLGAQIFITHQQEHMTHDISVVVYTSAVNEQNPEMAEAKNRNIPLMKRAEMLAEIMRLKCGLAVAGTHGKTTTSSCLATILEEAGYDPTYIIGGIVRNLGRHAKVGEGDFLIAETDESDGSFLLLNPVMSVITNIDRDHMDYYETDEKLISAFEQFANKIPFFGICALNAHDEQLMKIQKRMRRPSVNFGIEGEQSFGHLDYAARNIVYSEHQTKFSLVHQGTPVVEIAISILGRHNILNALGAICLAHNAGLQFSEIAKAIAKFEGVARRLQLIHKDQKLEIFDDYAHHPTAVSSTLKTLRQMRDHAHLVLIFEPHRYTRTQDCWSSFLHCFNYADEVFLMPIYPASEIPIEGITTERLVADINQIHPGLCTYLETTDELKKILRKTYKDHTIIAALGAGSISRKVRDILNPV